MKKIYLNYKLLFGIFSLSILFLYFFFITKSFVQEENSITRIIFIRHGTTDWSWEMMSEGTKDLPINKEGKSFISNISDTLIQKTHLLPQIIISSPLLRCKETATIIQQKYLNVLNKKIPILISDTVQGPKYGQWSYEEKKHISNIVDSIKNKGLDTSKSKKLLVEKLKEFPKSDKESWDHFQKRTINAIDIIANKHKGNIVVVTHGSFCEEYLKAKDKYNIIDPDYWKDDNRPPLIIKYNYPNIEPQIFKLL